MQDHALHEAAAGMLHFSGQQMRARAPSAFVDSRCGLQPEPALASTPVADRPAAAQGAASASLSFLLASSPTLAARSPQRSPPPSQNDWPHPPRQGTCAGMKAMVT